MDRTNNMFDSLVSVVEELYPDKQFNIYIGEAAYRGTGEVYADTLKIVQPNGLGIIIKAVFIISKNFFVLENRQGLRYGTDNLLLFMNKMEEWLAASVM